MLPQIKRPQHDDGEVEIEVVDVRNVDGTNVADDDPTVMASNKMFRASSAPPAHAREQMPNEHVAMKPSHMKKGVFGDEPTQLMPAKNSKLPNAAAVAASTRSASVRPSGLPEARVPSSRSSRGSERPSTRPAGSFSAPLPRIPIDAPPPSFNMRDREDSHTMLRPLGDLSDQAKQILAESKAQSSAASSAMAVPSAGAIKAQVDAARAKRLADQRARAAETLEVTPVSISERFVVKGRPATPWAIAFVAMGIFAGATTVVFTGGRASAIAAFIDPARDANAALAAASPQNGPNAMGSQMAAPIANDPAANLLPGANANANGNAGSPSVSGAPLDVAPMTPTVFAVGRASQTQQAAQPAQPAATQAAPAPVAAQPRPTPHVADPTPAPRPTPAPVAKADPKPDPKPAADPTPKVAENSPPKSDSSSSRHHASSRKPAAAAGGGGDVDSAAAADALAKAQLENSL